METLNYKCYKCGKNYAKEEIRLTAENKITCVYCLGIKHKEIEKTEIKREMPKEEYIDYVCGACNYSFKRKKSFVLLSCPYCNKKGTLAIKKSQDAGKLLKDSQDRKYDF